MSVTKVLLDQEERKKKETSAPGWTSDFRLFLDNWTVLCLRVVENPSGESLILLISSLSLSDQVLSPRGQ